MNVQEILEILKLANKLRVKLFVEDGKLGMKKDKASSIPTEFVASVKANKDHLIQFLEREEFAFNGEPSHQVVIAVGDRPDHLPLSFTQERLWIVDKLDGSIQYHLPALLRVSGALDLAVLSSSLRAVVARHESLRTIFYEEDGNAYQRIISAENFSITELSPALFDNGLVSKTTLSELLAIPFDLSSDYMIRASHLSLDSDDHVLLLEMHHIASDGWSIPLLVKELESIYSAQLLGEQANLPLLPIQYADYSLWQRNYLQGGLLESKLDYWVTHLDGVEVLSLPTDYPRPPVQQTDGSRHRFEIGSELTKELRSICHDQGATLFMVLLSMYKILLSKYSGQSDICVGVPIANRDQTEVSSLIGFFVNTLALRSEVGQDLSYLAFLSQIKEMTLSGYSHQDVPFERVVDRVVRTRDLSRTPLFQTMFVLQNNEQVVDVHLGDNKVSFVDFSSGTSKFDLEFIAVEHEDHLALEIEYSTALFKQETIERMSFHFKELIQSILENQNAPIGSFNHASRIGAYTFVR